DPIVICNEAHRFLAAEQLREIGILNPRIMLEPLGRNTAPALALAALHILAFDDDAMLLVLPADHLIQNTTEFHRCVTKAAHLASLEKLVTFGVAPTRNETGYGYLERGDALGEYGATVRRFVEKPDASS